MDAFAAGRWGAAVILVLHLACSSTSQPGSNAQATEPVPATERSSAAPQPMRCSIRVTSKGATVDGDLVDLGRAVALCKARTEALVERGEDVSDGEWNEVRTALTDAGVTVLMRGPRGIDDCKGNPLAKGCM